MSDESRRKQIRNEPGLANPRSFLRGIHLVTGLVIFLLGLNVLLVYVIFFSQQGIFAYRQQSAQVRELEAKVQALEKENSRLFDRIHALRNDSTAQERLVRRHLGWVRENELVFEFPQETSE